MCLIVNKHETNLIKESNQEIFTFYKVFAFKKRLFKNANKIKPIYFGCFITKAGVVKAKGKLEIFKENKDLKLVDESLNVEEIRGGVCHAFLNFEKADSLSHSIWLYYDCLDKIVLPIQVKKEDIVAVGFNDDVCFKKYEITEDTWNTYLR